MVFGFFLTDFKIKKSRGQNQLREIQLKKIDYIFA